MLNESGESEHPCLVPYLTGNTFKHFTTECDFSCGFVMYGLYYVEVGFFYALCPLSAEFFFFNHKWVLNFVKSFFLYLFR